MEERCRNCKEVLFRKFPLDKQGHMAMDLDTALPLEREGDQRFFTCRNCSARNLAQSTTSPDSLPQLRIYRAIPAEEGQALESDH